MSRSAGAAGTARRRTPFGIILLEKQCLHVPGCGCARIALAFHLRRTPADDLSVYICTQIYGRILPFFYTQGRTSYSGCGSANLWYSGCGSASVSDLTAGDGYWHSLLQADRRRPCPRRAAGLGLRVRVIKQQHQLGGDRARLHLQRYGPGERRIRNVNSHPKYNRGASKSKAGPGGAFAGRSNDF